MNLTIAIQPTSPIAVPGAGGIAPAEGENGMNVLFSLEIADLTTAVTPEAGVAAELALGAPPIPVAPAEAALSGSPLPPMSGKTLPILPPSLPTPPAAPLAKEHPPEAKQANPAAQPFSIAITAEGDPPPPPTTTTAATDTAERQPLPSALLTPERQESPLPRGEAQPLRAVAAPQPESEDAQPQQGGGGGHGQEGKSGKPPAAAPAADRPAQAPTSAPVLVTAGPAAIPQVTAPTASDITMPNFRPAATETPPQEFEAIIQRLTEARETARPASADITLLHREFGHVAMQLDMAGRQLRVSLASADADFAPAVQAALAERGPLPVVEPSRAENGSSFSGQGREGYNAPPGRNAEPGPQSRPASEIRHPVAKGERRGSGLFA